MRAHHLGAVTIAAIGALASTASAAPAVRPNLPQVSGEVVDREGGAVAGVTVIARDVKHRMFRTITDDAGRFQLDGMPIGDYFFIALHPLRTAWSPALPVSVHLDVVLHLDDEPVRA